MIISDSCASLLDVAYRAAPYKVHIDMEGSTEGQSCRGQKSMSLSKEVQVLRSIIADRSTKSITQTHSTVEWKAGVGRFKSRSAVGPQFL